MGIIRHIIIHLVGTVASSGGNHQACRGCEASAPLHLLGQDTGRTPDSEVVIDLREPSRRRSWLAAAACDPYCTGCRPSGIDIHPSAF